MLDLVDHLPRNWPELSGLVVFVAYTLWRDRRADKKVTGIGATATEVHKQTVNGHDPEETNLRDDVDKSIRVSESAAASGAVTVRMLADFRDEVRAGFKQIGRDIGGIREEIRTERTERIEGDRRR